ncbi:NADH-quinone oxidoreductase subunit NuoN [Marinicella sp. S1101]|uniref:NADH-quinone oxidoreductase subunit NuoN n=1 Tax=Marinicella marina TaxID=2996016 RepID=UPI0022609E2C|nr:NADH-quinone oxidoreductase subunit NuoN [Marinicella marina]MCX7554124.1 NADH-quinone oxidoreductase subunit NuoN [Marinicella marina]MDJ1141183.1 NADH-quinone oxidoreductase subunit NuoN [Marinicella marina]
MFGWSELVPAFPEILVLSMACVVLLVGLFTDKKKGGFIVFLSVITMMFAAILTLKDHVAGVEFTKTVIFNGTFIRDEFGDMLKVVVYLLMISVFFYAKQYLRQHDNLQGEYFALLLFATLGIMVMISGHNFIALYLGLELLALSSYALVAYNRNDLNGNEAAMKYFILGALASGMLLYGMSLIYGAVGTLQINEISQAIAGQNNDMFLVLGLIFVIVGIGFKLGAAPFHMWVPDVYEGAPTATTLFIASAPKIAAFALAVRILGQSLDVLMIHWQSMLATLAIVSIIVGNLFALQQTNLKRLFAYSTISHIGFMLLGLVGGAEGIAASMFYIIVYTIMAVGGFGMIVLLSNKGMEADQIADFKGLNQRSGWYAFLMLLLVASMAGFPPLIGFFSKLYVLKAVIDQGHIILAAVAVIFAVIGAFYYLKIIKVMYFEESETDQAIDASFDVKTVLSINALAQLGLLVLLPVLFQYCIRVTGSL